MTDNVNHPSHYNNGSVECIDAMEAATVNKSGAEAICTSNVIKYLWRYEAKNGLEDVKKAQWYLNRLIAELEGKPAVTPEETQPRITQLDSRTVAGIKADGLEEFAKYVSLYSSNAAWHAINFAKQLREGVNK